MTILPLNQLRQICKNNLVGSNEGSTNLHYVVRQGSKQREPSGRLICPKDLPIEYTSLQLRMFAIAFDRAALNNSAQQE